MENSPIRLTEYSHGAGCGCKISPQVLDTILASQLDLKSDPNLLVGHSSKDDAAAYDLGDGRVILSTTDFFMPIADDPFDFGRIAATNAISEQLPGFISMTWFGVFGPAGMPQSVVNKLNASFNKVLKDPQVKEQLAKMGIDGIGGTPADFTKKLATDTQEWQKVISDAKITLQ